MKNLFTCSLIILLTTISSFGFATTEVSFKPAADGAIEVNVRLSEDNINNNRSWMFSMIQGNVYFTAFWDKTGTTNRSCFVSLYDTSKATLYTTYQNMISSRDSRRSFQYSLQISKTGECQNFQFGEVN